MSLDLGFCTIHIGSLCGGNRGILIRYFGKSPFEKWRYIMEWEVNK